MVDVRGRVEGYIEKWLFRPGQEVTAGQALYILDLRPFQAQVQQAQGTLKQTEADLDFAQRQVSLRQAEANLAAAQSNLVKAQQDYERLKPLVEQDAAAKQDLDAAVAALRSAEASVRANQANVEQTRLTTETQVQSTQGKVQAQRGALETATLNVQYGTIHAPISGLIGDTLVPVGGLVNPNAAQPLTTIVPLDPIWVRFKVSEAQYLAFMGKKGGPAKEGPKLQLVLADNSVFPADRQGDEHAQSGGPADRHAGIAGRIPQSAASPAARPVRAHPLRCRAPHGRDPGAAARGAAEPEHTDRVHRGRGDKIEARAGEDRRAHRRCLADRTGTAAGRSRGGGRPADRASGHGGPPGAVPGKGRRRPSRRRRAKPWRDSSSIVPCSRW